MSVPRHYVAPSRRIDRTHKVAAMRRLGLSPHDKPRARAGQSVVEFALVSLTILLIVFGIVDIGRGVFQRSMLTNATREAARYAAVNPTSSSVMLAAAQKT